MDNFFMEADTVVVSALFLPEIISTLSRLHREKRLNAVEYNKCKREAVEDFVSFEVCDVSPEILNTSVQILEHTDLRAADAIHLASAIKSKAAIFISSDKKQILAAKKFNLMVNSV